MNVLLQTSNLHQDHQIRGVGSYTRNLLDHLRQLPTNHQFATSQEMSAHQADVIHYPFFDLFFSTLPLSHSQPTVVTIHDVIPLLYPKQYKPGIKGSLRHWKQRLSLERVSAILTDSFTSAADIVTYLLADPQKVYPVYLAGEPSIAPIPHLELMDHKHRYRLPDRYLLYVGDINFNKNLEAFLLAFADLLLTHADAKLVMVSQAMAGKSREQRLLSKLLSEPGLKEASLVLTNVPSWPAPDLSALYQLAHGYVQPSLSEGFGLTVLEAMQAGTPVLCSTAPALKEVAHQAALYMDPDQIHLMSQALAKLWTLPQVQRKKLIQLGRERAQEFSWVKTAQKTNQVYEAVYAART